MSGRSLSLRFWSAILLASVFGTNMGDFVARSLHLGHVQGLPPLAILFALVLLAGRRPGGFAEPAFWVAIAVLRTGATNIADFANHQMHVSAALLVPVLALLMAVLALLDRRAMPDRGPALARLGTSYWSTMLVAGVLGTVAGDAAEDLFGDGAACLVLALVLLPFIVLRSADRLPGTLFYWLTIALARTLGTAIGDTLADRDGLGLGVPLSTLLTFIAFAGLLLLWQPVRRPAPQPAT
jgi:uncharacterized membrane-anchored protein